MVDQLNKNCYTKECPVCGKLLKYKRKQALVNSIKLNRKCSSCANTGKNNPFYGKQHTESHKNYISKVLKTSISYKESRIKLSQQMKGRCISESTKIKISRSVKDWHLHNENPMLGKNHTTESKNKIRTKVKEWVANYKNTDEYKDWINRKDEYSLYRIEVDKITKSNDLTKLKNFSKKNLYHKYEIDHIYPISIGFKNNIPPSLIGSIDNLRIIPRFENRRKSSKIIEEIIPNNIRKYINETNN